MAISKKMAISRKLLIPSLYTGVFRTFLYSGNAVKLSKTAPRARRDA